MAKTEDVLTAENEARVVILKKITHMAGNATSAETLTHLASAYRTLTDTEVGAPTPGT